MIRIAKSALATLRPKRARIKCTPRTEPLLNTVSGEMPRSGPVLCDDRAPEVYLDIPVCDTSAEVVSRKVAQDRGQFLARQDRWQDLADALRAADAARETTPGGMPVADLMAFGARADVVQAVEHALMDVPPPSNGSFLAGITDLEYVLEDMPTDPMIAAIVAMAHVDLGWAWRSSGGDAATPLGNHQTAAVHFDRAATILSEFSQQASESPLVAAAYCAMLPGQAGTRRQVADTYQALIQLDPQNQRHMRAMGTHLLPRWFGSHEELELEARRCAAQTQQIWGHGGYTWVQMDAISLDDIACEQVDVPYFVDGLRDIVARRPDQAMINLWAAYCSLALPQGFGLNDRADLARGEICACAKWLIRDHLTEVHPLIWAHAAERFDNAARITSISRFAARGKADALRAIAEQFSDDINRGFRVRFTPDGHVLHPV